MASTPASLLKPTVTHWGAYSARVAGGQIAALEPFAADPDPSPIGPGMVQAIADPLRIPRPMIRQGWLKHGPRRDHNARGSEPFVSVPWDEALDIAARELTRIKTAYGNAAIYAGSYGWASAGRFHHAQGTLRRFLNLFGGHAYSKNTYSAGAAEVIVPRVMGEFWGLTSQLTTWDVIAEHTQLFVAFGGFALKNAQVHGGGFGRHVAKESQRKLMERGVRVVTIGAVRDDTGAVTNAEWLAPRPNTDVALMMGLAHTLVSENLHDRGFLASHCVGWEKFEPYLMGTRDGTPKSADWAAAITGIPATTIAALARAMARQRTMISISWSLQRADHGEQTYWMAITLAAMLGQIGLPGGGIGFAYAGANGIGASGARLAPPSLPIPANPIKAYIPVARIADMLEHPGESFAYDGESLAYPDARMVYWCGGNPFHHHQDLGRLVRAWQRPETVIVHEAWWNANARHADIVFPVTTTLERNDITGTAQDTYGLAMHQAIAPVGEARNDFAIFSGLAHRLGFGERYTEGRDEMGWLTHLYGRWRERAQSLGIALPSFETFWQQGHVELPDRGAGTIFLKDFRADPVAHRLSTPSGKIEIFSDAIDGFGYDDCPGHATWFQPVEWLGAAKARQYPLHMISNQPRTRLHSQYDNGGYAQSSKIQGREPVWLNPADAAPRGISSGDVVRLSNDRGACLAGAVVTDAIRPGVIQLATGAWFSSAPRTGAEHGGNDLPFCVHGNPNVLTRDAGTSRLAQGSSAQTCLVEVEKWVGELPDVAAMKPPVVRDRM
ncbi:MAG: Asp-tRNA(Asn)/Glu-tRNA(Gln) amidotransferase GatCAB subunit C [Alphaproteobacteria bacterium]|nr:Asp-tRNA(Asn)/Glu-tRNA(Gln) amidotransferase GatCAB subunit C [Alphaproteobacteria bacterium]